MNVVPYCCKIWDKKTFIKGKNEAILDFIIKIAQYFIIILMGWSLVRQFLCAIFWVPISGQASRRGFAGFFARDGRCSSMSGKGSHPAGRFGGRWGSGQSFLLFYDIK